MSDDGWPRCLKCGCVVYCSNYLPAPVPHPGGPYCMACADKIAEGIWGPPLSTRAPKEPNKESSFVEEIEDMPC